MQEVMQWLQSNPSIVTRMVEQVRQASASRTRGANRGTEARGFCIACWPQAEGHGLGILMSDYRASAQCICVCCTAFHLMPGHLWVHCAWDHRQSCAFVLPRVPRAFACLLDGLGHDSAHFCARSRCIGMQVLLADPACMPIALTSLMSDCAR